MCVTLFPMLSHAQTAENYYQYSYDNVGNIIFRGKTNHQNRQEDVFGHIISNGHAEADSLVMIDADPFWSEVKIELKGEIKTDESMSIYTSDGVFIASFRIPSNKFSLNLSTLRKGTYMFRFYGNKTQIQKKYIKRL